MLKFVKALPSRPTIQRVGRISLLFAVVTLLIVMPSSAVEAQVSEEEVPPPQPVVIVSIGGVERALRELGAMFEAAGRPDMIDVVDEFITNVAGDLKGIDRTRPIGFMLFLEPGLPPQPVGVGFIPVDDLEDLIQTAGLGRMKLEKKAGTEDEFELRGRRGGTQHVKFVGGYLYISESETIIEEELPDPLQTFSSFVSRYDLSASFQVRNIPQAIRDVFATMLRTHAETELQQRDDESDAAYQMRKANGLSATELMEQILSQGEQITIGLDASADGNRAVVDVLIDAKPDSEFASYLKNIGGKGTMFEPALQEDRPLTVSLSWTMDRREKEGAAGFFQGLETALKQELSLENADVVDRLFKPIQATIEKGHADAFLQFAPEEQDEMVLIGGLRVIGGQTFAGALRDLLAAMAEDPEIKLDDVALDVETHEGVTFHRVTGSGVREDDERLYGGQPDIFVGADARAIWFAVGKEGALTTLYGAMDTINSAQPGIRQTSLAPFQAVFRLAPWLKLPPREGQDPIGRELAAEAIEGGDDVIRLEVRPTNTGGRIRLQFDNGFVRLLGLLLAHQYDRTQL